jgi:hypothetical protein
VKRSFCLLQCLGPLMAQYVDLDACIKFPLLRAGRTFNKPAGDEKVKR